MINISHIHTELKKKGKQFTYIKVKCALDGVPNSTSDKEKKEIMLVIDEGARKAKENVLKS